MARCFIPFAATLPHRTSKMTENKNYDFGILLDLIEIKS